MNTETISYPLNLAGQHWTVNVSRIELETVHVRLLQDVAHKAVSKKLRKVNIWPVMSYELQDVVHRAVSKRGRYVVLLAGPPGSGKTTLGALWETLAGKHYLPDLPAMIQTLPMDGFHFPNKELDRRTIIRDGQPMLLRKIKGAPETFDLPMITNALRELCSGNVLAWPKYDRQIHDPVSNAIPVMTEGVIIVEGNYLLLDEPGWRDLKLFADLTIFVECVESLSKERLLSRAIRGGRLAESATEHWVFSDSSNWQRIMQHRLDSDVVFRVEEDGHIVRIK
jgi:pantothenate kinase